MWLVFLPAGDASCKGAAKIHDVAGGIATDGTVQVKLTEEITYKVCTSTNDVPMTDAQFHLVMGVSVNGVRRWWHRTHDVLADAALALIVALIGLCCTIASILSSLWRQNNPIAQGPIPNGVRCTEALVPARVRACADALVHKMSYSRRKCALMQGKPAQGEPVVGVAIDFPGGTDPFPAIGVAHKPAPPIQAQRTPIRNTYGVHSSKKLLMC